MLRFTWISPSPLNEGNGETSSPNGSCLVCVTDFLIFTVPANECTSVLSFYLYFVLSQIFFSYSLRLFYILSFGVGGSGCGIEYVALLDGIPWPSPKTYSTSYSRKKTGKWKSGITLQLDPSYPLLKNIFVFYFILLWRAVWRLTSSLIRFLHVVLMLCKNTIFLKGHLSQHQCQNESVWIADVLINPFEGLKCLIKNKGKHGSPLKPCCLLCLFSRNTSIAHMSWKMTLMQSY